MSYALYNLVIILRSFHDDINNLNNLIVDITIFRRPFVFIQSYVQISASLADVRGLAVAVFDLVDCSLSVVRFVLVFNIC